MTDPHFLHHHRITPMSPRTIADATGDYGAAGMDKPADDVPPVFSFRSVGVAAAMLLAIVLFITLIGVIQHG